MSRLSQKVRSRRLARDLSLVEAARRAGVAKSYLSMIENDRLDNPPSSAVLGRIERAVGAPVGELVRLAAWERTPASVRAEAAELSETAARARSLGHWLTQSAMQGGGGLDRLYHSGELRRRIEQILGRDSARGPHPKEPTRACDAAPRRPDQEPGIPLSPRSVPLINKVAAGYPADFTDLGYPARVADEYVRCPPGLDDPDVFAAFVHGESMLPEYRDGDVVIFSPLADVIDGCDCFVRLEDSHETTFKRVYLEEEGRRIRLQPLNPRFAPQTRPREEVAGVYRAVWRMSRL